MFTGSSTKSASGHWRNTRNSTPTNAMNTAAASAPSFRLRCHSAAITVAAR